MGQNEYRVRPVESNGPGSWVGRLRAADLEAPAVWAALPELVMRSTSGALGRSSAPGRTVRSIRRAIARKAGATLTETGRVVVADVSVQTRRVTAPVAEHLSRLQGTPQRRVTLPPLAPRALLRASRISSSNARAVDAAFERVGLRVVASARDEILKGELAYRRFRELLGRTTTVVMVATQHNTAVRALLAAAADVGTPTVYLPHAPLAGNVFYDDLPVTVALLRGPAELEHYAAMGAAPSRMRVVGMPAEHAVGGVRPEPSGRVLFAPSPRGDESVRSDAAVVEAAVAGAPVVVSLHPRMDPAAAVRLFPGSWELAATADTAEFLRNEAPVALVQHGSGVGLEAMLAGVEVIELCAADETPHYPYLREPHVQVAFDAEGLSAAIGRLGERGAAADSRLSYALTWCSMSGPDAAASAAQAVLDAAALRAAPLLDGWRRICVGAG